MLDLRFFQLTHTLLIVVDWKNHKPHVALLGIGRGVFVGKVLEQAKEEESERNREKEREREREKERECMCVDIRHPAT